MRLTIIGSGTSIIRKERKAPCFLLEVVEKKLLFDCGWGAGLGILEAEYKIEDLDHIFITHPHADHLGNLMNLLQSIYVQGLYFTKKKRTKPFYLHGYKGFRDDYQKLREMMFPEGGEPYEIKIFEYAFNSREQDEMIIQAREVQHCPERFHAVGYRIQYKDKAFVYSGDTGYTDELIRLAFHADLAIFEMGISIKEYKELGPRPNHLSPYECGLIAQKAGVKKLIVSHLNDLSNPKDAQAEIHRMFQGEIIFAKDLLVVET